MIIEKLNNNKKIKGQLKDIPEEGTLMPSTYFYKFMDTRESIIKKMKNKMKLVINKIKSKNTTKLTEREIIILASIIEKETGKDYERKIISSVFYNRLKSNMRLQSCPTVIYAISSGYGKINRKLTLKDLKFMSPYNTYRNNGLPPTAICGPSENSIEAAMNPANTKYFYFVANSDRLTHMFSENFKDHRKNILNLAK
jgi:UPF0755 protein